MKITKKEIKEKLLAGKSIYTRATAMQSGSHRYWIENHGDGLLTFHCFGSGQGWQDQNDNTTINSINEMVDCLYNNRAAIFEIE